MEKFSLIEDVLGYVTNVDETNTSEKYLTSGSKNVLIDREKKVGTRAGFTYAFEGGEINEATRSGGVWKTSTGTEIPWRFTTAGKFLAYFGTVDGEVIDSWYELPTSGLNGDYPMRQTSWWNTAKSLDYFLAVNHSDSVYYWSGGFAVVDSVGRGALYGIGGVTAGGTGYTVGDILTVTGGGGTGGTIRVLTLGGSNAVATFEIVTVGTGYTAGAGLTTTGGTGASCTINISTTSAWIKKKGSDIWTTARFNPNTDTGIYNVTRGTTGAPLITPGSTDGSNSGSLTTTTLAPSGPAGTAAGDILISTFYENADEPTAGRTNDNIFVFQNQVFLSSTIDNQVFMASESNYTDYTFSTPRVPGEGALFQLDNVDAKFAILSKQLVIFAGDNRYLPTFQQITVGTTLSETINVQKYTAGLKQGVYSQETIIQVDEAIAYLSNEPALRMVERPEDLGGRQLKSLSNPIKPDFDSADLTGACGVWANSRITLSIPDKGLYILEFVESADGQVRRYWQPPQTLYVSAFFDYGGYLYGFSPSDGKTSFLFNGISNYTYDWDTSTAEKFAVNAKMVRSWNSYGDRFNLKNFDEQFVEGYISASTSIDLYLYTDSFDNETIKTIDGSDTSILFGSNQVFGLGQQSLGVSPLAGALESEVEVSKFRVIFEMPKEDFNERLEIFETDDIDLVWTIISSGVNAKLSPRKNISIKQ